MSRLFVKGRLSVGKTVSVDPPDVHYLKNVLRLTTGDVVLLVDDAGEEFRSRMTVKKGNDVGLEVTERLPARQTSTLSIRLFAGLMKGKKMERLARDAVALGVESLTPFISSRTIPKDIGDMKLERIKKIAIEESRLSGRNRPLLVHPPVPFSETLRSGADLSLFLWEEETRDISNVVKGARDVPATVSLFSGPEGGFSAEEAAEASDAGLVAVSLGPRIIRAETAPLVAVAVVQYEWGDL